MIEIFMEMLVACKDKVWDYANKYYQKILLWNFKRKEKKDFIDQADARDIAHSILSGYIVSAIPYKNFNSNHNFIAVRRRSSQDGHDERIYIIESFGNTFRAVWNSENIFDRKSLFEVLDLDKDGIKEIVFLDESFGTGGGSRTLFVYSCKREQLYQITESYHWADAAGPVSPQIEIQPETDSGFIEDLEKYAVRKGLLDMKRVDLGAPEFASERWHADNGRKRTGFLKLHYYEGRSVCGASITAEIETDDIIWTAFFKGPLVGYIKSKDKHFIAYSPSWIYNWAKCLIYYENKLWFGIHSDLGVMTFTFAKDKGYLEYFTHYDGNVLPDVKKILFNNSLIIINDTLKIPINCLKKIQEPKNPQGVLMPH